MTDGNVEDERLPGPWLILHSKFNPVPSALIVSVADSPSIIGLGLALISPTYKAYNGCSRTTKRNAASIAERMK